MNGSTKVTDLEGQLVRILAGYAARADTHAVQFALTSPGRRWDWQWVAPGAPTPYFIASTTKLYVTALIMQLRAEGRIDIDAPAAALLDPSIMAGIHSLRGVDASGRITVRQLLSHTSGIADYFEQRRRDGSSQFADALAHDAAWTFEDVLPSAGCRRWWVIPVRRGRCCSTCPSSTSTWPARSIKSRSAACRTT